MPDIEIKRGYEVLPDNNVRFGIRVINNSDVIISDVEVLLDYSESLFQLEGSKVQKLGTIPPSVPRTAKFILKPLGCIHKEKSIKRSDFLTMSQSGFMEERGVSFEGISVDKLVDFLAHTCKNRLYKVDEFTIENGKILYLAGDAVGEKAYYLLTAVVKEYEGLTQVLLRVNSDKSHGLNGFLNETLDNLRHLVVSTSAREIGIIKKEQVINIIDSVVQRTTFSDGEGAAQVNIRDSMVHRTEGLARKEEEERQRKIEPKRALHVSSGLAGSRGTAKDKDDSILVQKASLLIRDGNYPPAISLLKKAMAIDPGNMRIESILREAKKEWGQILLRQNH